MENAFGNQLRKLRVEKGYTTRKFGDSVGVSHTYISQIETGTRNIPKVETLKKIANGLDISLKDLFIMAGYIK